MNRAQAEALVFRALPPEDRGTYANGVDFMIVRTPTAPDAYYRDVGERLPMHRLSDDELRALLPEHVRGEFQSRAAA